MGCCSSGSGDSSSGGSSNPFSRFLKKIRDTKQSVDEIDKIEDRLQRQNTIETVTSTISDLESESSTIEVGVDDQPKFKEAIKEIGLTKAQLKALSLVVNTSPEELNSFLESLKAGDGEKTSEFEDSMKRESNEAAKQWWIKAKDKPDPVIGLTGGDEATRQNYLDLGPEVKVLESIAYLQQLYYDAGKAQKRLKDIATTMGKEGTGIDGFDTSMPDIKGMARASFKSGLEKKRLYDELKVKNPRTPEEEKTFEALKNPKNDVSVGDEAHPLSSGLRDLARGTVEVSKLTDVPKAMLAFFSKTQEMCKRDDLPGKPTAELTRFKNKFEKLYEELMAGKLDDGTSKTGGYADIQIHLRVDGGHICEMQVNCTALLNFKSGTSSHRGDKSGSGESWYTLLPTESRGLLTTAKQKLSELALLSIASNPPKDAKKSMDVFAKCDNEDWPLDSHVIYNITRWLDEDTVLKDNETAKGVSNALKALSAAGAKACLLKSDPSATSLEDIKNILEKIAAFNPAPGSDIETIRRLLPTF